MRINGVDVKEIDELRDNIEKHFGSIHSFHKVSKYSYGKLKNTLLNLEFTKQTFEEIKEVYNEHLNVDKVPFRISSEDVDKIRICIYSNFKRVKHFCDKHPEYNTVFMSNLLNNKAKLESDRFNNLVKLLERKYNLEL